MTRCACTSGSRRSTRFERSRRGHPRARLVHRVLPAVRLRPARLRGALRGEARAVLAAAEGEAGHLAGHDCARRSTTRTCSRRPRTGSRPGSGVGGTPGVRRARRPARATASCSRSSADRPLGSARSSISTTARSPRSAASCLPVGVHSPGHIAETDQQAWEEAYPGFEAMNNTIGRERGWPPYSRVRFQHDVGPEGALYVGSPETRGARRSPTPSATLGLSRFDLKFATGTLSHEKMMRIDRAVRHRGHPRVRELLAES